MNSTPLQQLIAQGLQLHEHGNLDAAAECYRNALNIRPDHPDALHLSGLISQAHGQYAEAERLISRAVKAAPRIPFYWFNLGELHRQQSKWQEAAHAYAKAAKLQPDWVEAHGNQGIALRELGKLEEAEKCFRRVVQLRPPQAADYVNLGSVAAQRGNARAAEEAFRRALALDAHCYEAQFNLGNILLEQKQPGSALDCLQRCLGHVEDDWKVLFGLAHGYYLIGEAGKSMDMFRRAAEINPLDQGVGKNLLALLLYMPGLDSQRRFLEHVLFAERHSPMLPWGANAFARDMSSSHRIRIGYVSSDLRIHPVARNLASLLEVRDRSRFEVYAYGDVAKPDDITKWFEANCDGWRSIRGLSDAEAAELIRRDGIDILVILAGRFDQNRPLIASYRAAPIQVSMHDAATSGLLAMDYLISDGALSPKASSERFTEQLVRLPTFYLHEPLEWAAEPASPPALTNGYVTFASFNNPAKISEPVVALWARLMHALPGSRLVLKYQAMYADAAARERIVSLFRKHGVNEDRLDTVAEHESWNAHLARYAQVDIGLDPFPFSGSTTTFEALWMGVPVLTLPEDSMVSRWTAAMLKKVGLANWVALDSDDFVTRGQALAQDVESLVRLRAGLRERVRRSPLCDVPARARQLERVYRWMWRKWCARQETVRPTSVAEGVAACEYGDVDLNLEIGEASLGMGHLRRATQLFRQAAAMQPENERAGLDLGAVLRDQGRIDEAQSAFRQVLAHEPDSEGAMTNLIFCANYSADYQPDMVLALCRDWVTKFAGHIVPCSSWENTPDPERRLRIGYVSPDFKRHAVAYFSLPALVAHDHSRYEIFCYSSGKSSDMVTDAFRQHADVWRDVSAMPDQALADQVRHDRIDILVDMAGHTSVSRLLAFAHKPAPIQMTWLGYLNTTGLPAMDYRLTDAAADPVGTEDRYTETLIRLPHQWCYAPPPIDLPLGGLPADRNGHITFGSFNNYSKVSTAAVRVWAKLLQAIPTARLVLMAEWLDDIREEVLARFDKEGVAPERLDVSGSKGFGDYMRMHHQVDICLDSFPYAGGATTCHALWMGVPVVTMCGQESAFSRSGVSIHSAVGLPEWVALDQEAYFQIAFDLAVDRDRLRAFRQTLRGRLQGSPLVDYAAFTRSLEEAYRAAWRKWCAG